MGRIAKWETMLGAFDIKYLPCTATKGQVLADLVAKFTKDTEEVETQEGKMSGPEVLVISIPCPPSWEIYVDGGS